MHELTIAQNICDIVKRELEDIDGIKEVRKIRVKVGKLSGVVPDSLNFCFGFVSEGTPMEGASLEIEEIPVEVECNRCGDRFSLQEPLFVCPGCGSGDLGILAGQELLLQSIEVEEATV